MTFLTFLCVGSLLATFDSPLLPLLGLLMILFLRGYASRWATSSSTTRGIAEQNLIIRAGSMVGTAWVGIILNKLYSPDTAYRAIHLLAGALPGLKNDY